MASPQELVQTWLSSGGGSGSTSTAKTTQSPAESSGDSGDLMSPAVSDGDSDLIARAENSESPSLLEGEGEDTQTDSTESETEPASSSAPKATQKTSGKEVVTITDENGRKRKVEIDYSNREAIKKAHLMSAGARKWQAERDQAIKTRDEVRSQLEQRNKDWSTLESAFQKGPEALYDLLAGQRGAFDSLINQKIQRAEFLKTASPDQVKALEAREQAEQQARELDKIRKENSEFKKQVTEERETAELRSLESRVNPVFDKYRFADKLGNQDDEHMFDEMLWNSALKRLEPYEEQGLEITPELVDREFRTVASAIRRRIGVQAQKTASRTIQQKKQEATENAQAATKAAYRTGGVAEEARGMINSGNLTGLLKGWKKYGGLFNK